MKDWQNISTMEISMRSFVLLELVRKSRDSISGFCEKAGIDRAMLYQIFNGKRVPKVNTLTKILKTLGYNLKIA